MSTSTKMIVLKSSDDESFAVDCAENEIPIQNVTGEKHVGEDTLSDEAKEDLSKWDAEFMKIDQSKILDLMLASNYLKVRSLFELACQTIANEIAACKSADEIRAKLENDRRESMGF